MYRRRRCWQRFLASGRPSFPRASACLYSARHCSRSAENRDEANDAKKPFIADRSDHLTLWARRTLPHAHTAICRLAAFRGWLDAKTSGGKGAAIKFVLQRCLVVHASIRFCNDRCLSWRTLETVEGTACQFVHRARQLWPSDRSDVCRQIFGVTGRRWIHRVEALASP